MRWGVLPSLLPLAPLISWSTGHLRWGEHRGGMYVEITGRDPAGLAVTRSWELIAEGNGGPYIPSMACAAVIRRWLNDMPPPPGARAASDDIGLKDYAAGFAAKGIVTGHRLEQPDGGPLYRRLLGEAYERLAPSIQALHDITAATHFHGQATVTRGNNILAQKIANLFGFPHAASGVPVTVTLTPAAGREIWTRNFAGRSFTSTQEQGQGYFAGLNVERFGPLAFGLAMVERQGQLHLILRRWSAFGIALPRWLAPRNQAFEHDAGGRFNFSVDISLPLIGRLVKYQGYLEPYRAASLPIAST